MLIQGWKLFEEITSYLSVYQRHKYNKLLIELPLTCPNFLERVNAEVRSSEVIVRYDTGKLGDAYYLREVFPDAFTVVGLPKIVFDFLMSTGLLLFRKYVPFKRKQPLCVVPSIANDVFTLSFFYPEKDKGSECLKAFVKSFIKVLHEENPTVKINVENVISYLINKKLVKGRESLEPTTSFNVILEHLFKNYPLDKKKDKELYQRRCIFCGKEFVSPHKHTLFCSDRCRWSFETKLTRYKLRNELKSLREKYKARGLKEGEAKEKAYLELIKKYPFLQKGDYQRRNVR